MAHGTNNSVFGLNTLGSVSKQNQRIRKSIPEDTVKGGHMNEADKVLKASYSADQASAQARAWLALMKQHTADLLAQPAGLHWPSYLKREHDTRKL